MNVPLKSIALLAVVAAAASYALAHDDASAGTIVLPAPGAEGDTELVAPGEALPEEPAGEETADLGQSDLAGDDEAAALSWAAPPSWETRENPSAMRIATYRVRGKDEGAEAEVSVVRAGGGTDANVERWLGQLEDRGKEERRTKTVRGFEVTMVEAYGTYVGGMGGNDERRPGWGLVGAIVEAPGQPYFFKLTGPEATVRSARRDFDALVDSIAPAEDSIGRNRP